MSSEAHSHPSDLAHHFDSYEQQRSSASLGMWLFIAQEIMFFGALFTAYILYRWAYPDAFRAGSHELDITLGGINTLALIVSSLTMAMAVRSAQLNDYTGKTKNQTVGFLILTMLLGSVFLGIKAVEYYGKYQHHLIPGPSFHFDGPAEGRMFFNLYFAMTGLHALHMVVGIGLMLFVTYRAWQGAYTGNNHNFIEGAGLYWHFVDIVWIFLFPLLYLIGRHH